ncbi:hypothetical protein [Prochlorococcus sp. MIT 1306]|uniref:hypothetical protein n=1 Tax=Prochlorococcus sp. MIT 1306 TaxID=1799667 RepID=UPI0007B3AF36|nr:hypothetical protein [Prochlorococcus sp. MIT 1306]
MSISGASGDVPYVLFYPLLRYPPKAPAIAGAFYFLKHLNIGLKQPSISGTIDFQKVALMSSINVGIKVY